MAKYADLKGSIEMVQLEKGPAGLGLSLAGNKDRTKMSVFVCGLHPKGSAASDGRIRGKTLLVRASSQLYSCFPQSVTRSWK